MYRFHFISETRTLHYVELCCNSKIYVITHFYSGYVYVMYYFAIFTFVMMPCDDLDETNCPWLRAG
jgi:hypothetical protein